MKFFIEMIMVDFIKAFNKSIDTVPPKPVYWILFSNFQLVKYYLFQAKAFF